MTQQEIIPYQPKNHIRLVTATSLFDGHDAAINIIRRLFQSSGAEVIHLGHNRSAQDIVETAISEDAQGIAVTSYQGGHMEFFKYMCDLLKERNTGIKIFGGGGGTILPTEIEELHAYGVCRLYHPDDGRAMGLQGMVNDVLEKCDFPTGAGNLEDILGRLTEKRPMDLARAISMAENRPEYYAGFSARIREMRGQRKIPVLGITGPGGSGKSSLVDELIRRLLTDVPTISIAIISVDPSKRKTGGALLGDRIRMNAIHDGHIFMRSLATRQSNLALSKYVQHSLDLCRAAQFDLVIVETSGIGQSDTEIVEHSDVSLYVMTPEYGAATQLEKIDMLDFADFIAINKFDKTGAEDALHDVRKQFRRNRNLMIGADGDLPIFSAIASQFNDSGMNSLYRALMKGIAQKTGIHIETSAPPASERPRRDAVIPPERVRYLGEIVDCLHDSDAVNQEQIRLARRLFQIRGAIEVLRCPTPVRETALPILDDLQPAAGEAGELKELIATYSRLKAQLLPENQVRLKNWPGIKQAYSGDTYQYKVRDKIIEQELTTETLSHLKIPKIVLPEFEDWGEILRWVLRENVPGDFPFTAGVFPLKRQEEEPGRQFAGEGGPERTNRRFHYVSRGMPAKRLSTAFDAVSLYGMDPDRRPDIYGKIGNSGVSVATLDDAKKLYSGFDLADPKTSVSMTINGPAPMILGFFLNAAVDQQCERYIQQEGLVESTRDKIARRYQELGVPVPEYQGALPETNDGLGLLLLGVSGDQVLPRDTYERIKAVTLAKVRGTVQADILKEDQAQNTCIFSTEFALKMMGDIQEFFITRSIRNFYSVSISGYHIAEAGANPISQLAFTLANGFTFVEYYLSRGMKIDDFAPNLSYFFSNGMDAEYSVIGRVARRIWSRAMKYKYRGNERSQKLKYHIQTSGRSLHAQEIGFNDIRTTLQGLYGIIDNCNSLHTNAYDEAITTPTEESVRRAMAIQLIINRELGLTRNENPLQGSFLIERLTDLVEEEVLKEFRRISERGGVLGAMERMYQRSKIQDESMYYEVLKHEGKIPIMGVNTFLDSQGSPTIVPNEVVRSETEEKEYAIVSLEAFHQRNRHHVTQALDLLKEAAMKNENVFSVIMETAKVCSLGQMTQALYDAGGQYRRNM
jgi:methylmalonyl-CoA mutase